MTVLSGKYWDFDQCPPNTGCLLKTGSSMLFNNTWGHCVRFLLC